MQNRDDLFVGQRRWGYEVGKGGREARVCARRMNVNSRQDVRVSYSNKVKHPSNQFKELDIPQ